MENRPVLKPVQLLNKERAAGFLGEVLQLSLYLNILRANPDLQIP